MLALNSAGFLAYRLPIGMEQQKLSVFQDFLASLPPAALELLQLIYDSNSDLTRELERRKAEIKLLEQVGV